MEKKFKRRSPAEKQETLDLVKSISKRVKELEVTSYELSQAVPMSQPGIDKVLKGLTKMPDLDVMRQIDKYLYRTYESPDAQSVHEDAVNSQTGINTVMQKLRDIEDKIDKCALKQDIMFEIIRNAKAAELSCIDQLAKDKLVK